MNVFLASGGGFHSPQMAYQLQKHGCLGRYVTIGGVPRDIKKSLGGRLTEATALGFIESTLRYVPLINSLLKPWHWKDPLFASMAARHLTQDMDLVVSFANYALPSFEKARQWKRPTVLERSSAHILTQLKLTGYNLTKWVIEDQIKEYDLADWIFVPSKFVAKSMIENGIPEKKIILQPLGVDVQRFSPQQVRHRPFRLLYAGAVSKQKGILELLDAWDGLKDKISGELMLVGYVDETTRARLKRAQARVTHLPFVAQEKMPALYGQASAFILPSLQDGFGMVVLEAMACGLPVIVSRNAGANEFISNGKEGFTVEAGNAKEIADAIVGLYEDEKKWDSMRRAALAKAQTYSWDTYGESLVKKYQSLLLGGGKK